MIWQTRTLATFVAATVPVENSGDISPLLEQALAIGELAVDTADVETPHEQQRQAVTQEAQPGTFERFMGSFGSPKRWAGR